MSHLIETRSASTANVNYRAQQQRTPLQPRQRRGDLACCWSTKLSMSSRIMERLAEKLGHLLRDGSRGAGWPGSGLDGQRERVGK